MDIVTLPYFVQYGNVTLLQKYGIVTVFSKYSKKIHFKTTAMNTKFVPVSLKESTVKKCFYSLLG